jgi:hypothetical protein
MCGVDYYKRAVSFIKKHVENPKFFIFSNDHHWVENHIHIPHPTYRVKHNDVEKGLEDLYLMALCNHFIIANSSFSWWGAWLSRNEDKIVTTPNPWFISRQPNFININQAEHYHPIRNDYYNVFNESNQVIFRLNPSEYSSSFISTENVELKAYNNQLNIHTLEDKSELFLSDIHKFDEHNDVIFKLSLKGSSDDLIQILYYTNEHPSTYNIKNRFYTNYYENENVEMYIHLPKDAFLTDLKILPSSNKDTNILIKDLEFREVKNSALFPENNSPILIKSDPDNGAIDVARNKEIKVFFNEQIKIGHNYWIDLKDHAGNSVNIKKSIKGKVLTIKHPDLENNTKYILYMHTGALTGLEGQPVAPGVIKFTTATHGNNSIILNSLYEKITRIRPRKKVD